MEGEAAREGGERWEGRGKAGGVRGEANCMCGERKRILKKGREEQTEIMRKEKGENRKPQP